MRTVSSHIAECRRLLQNLTSGEIVRLDDLDHPPWFEPGRVCEVSPDTYWYFLELLPPRWISGSLFVFGEGSGPFRLFWRRQGRHFGRELTDADTRRFCQLTGTSLDS